MKIINNLPKLLNIEKQIDNIDNKLDIHKTSGDHNDRYYTKNQINEKNYIKIIKNDWSENIGSFRAFYDVNTKLASIGAEINIDGDITYPPVKTARADADIDGNNIPTTYLKKNAVINNNTVTEAGYALDARQANPNVSGSLGAQIDALNKKWVKRKTITKTMTGDYITFSRSELGIGEVYILDVNIARDPGNGYHFVIGHGVDSSGTLYAYFDGIINAKVTFLIHYVPI